MYRRFAVVLTYCLQYFKITYSLCFEVIFFHSKVMFCEEVEEMNVPESQFNAISGCRVK